jgi:hypothetical protein
MDRRSFPWEGITMLTKRRAVLEMPAEAQDSSAGGAVADGGFWIRFLPCLADTGIIFLALVVLLAPAAVAKEPAPAKPAPVAATATKEPAPQKAVPAPAARPGTSPEVAPSPKEKPKAKKRRAITRKTPPSTGAAAAAPPRPGRTPRYNDVMTAVMLRDRAGASEAIDFGSWVDRPSASGMTALMAAAMNGDAAMTELLLQHGADPNRSAAGGSVLDYALKSGDGKVVDLLKRAGAR